MRGLLAMEQREVVADVVNTCMLSAIHGLRKWDPRPQVQTLLTMLSRANQRPGVVALWLLLLGHHVVICLATDL